MLTWTNPIGLAQTLQREYPEADRLSVSADELRRMIVSLPGFADNEQPPARSYLDVVRWAWMRVADDGGNSVMREAC